MKNEGRQNQLETPVDVSKEKETGSGGERAQPQFLKKKKKKERGGWSPDGQKYGVSAEYWREFGKRKRFGRRQSQNSEGKLFYIGKAGGVYSTAYQETIP